MASKAQPGSGKGVADGLARVLADTYALALTTQNFHWNVTGPHFHDRHKLFEALYAELNGAVDGIAERMRALGAYAPGSLGAYARLTAIKEVDRPLAADDMLRRLAEGHAAAAASCQATLQAAQKASDEVTADLMIQRLAAHEKALWMLRSTLA